MWIERDGELIPRPIKAWSELGSSLAPEPGEASLTGVLMAERHADRAREGG
jgi:hypothetical protein